jgi:hypothetical protein
LTIGISGGIENSADAAQNPSTGFRTCKKRVSCRCRAARVRIASFVMRLPGSVILSGSDGDDAHHYQEKQVRNAIREATK